MQPTGYGGSSLTLYREWAARQAGGNGGAFPPASTPQQPFISYHQPYEQMAQPSYGYSSYAAPVMQVQREAQLLDLQTRLLNARRENLRYKQELGRSIIQQSTPQPAYAQPNVDNRQYQRPMMAMPQPMSGQGASGSMSARNYQPSAAYAPAPTSGRMPGDDRAAGLMASGNAPKTSVPYLKMPENAIDQKQASGNSQVRFSQDDDFNSRMQPPSSNPFNQHRLNNLNENLNQLVQDNKKAIENDKTKLLPKAKQQQQEKKNANYQARQDIESLLKKKGQMTKMPLWRHRLQGNMNPPRESIMGGKSLFRAIAYSVIGMLIGPAHTVFLRKAEKKESNTKEFSKTLQIVTEGIEDWMSKFVQLPLASIINDDSVDFDPRDSFVNGSTSAFRNRMIQLKVSCIFTAFLLVCVKYYEYTIGAFESHFRGY